MVSYGAIALAVGAALFLAAVWLPALREAAGGGDSWRQASEAFAGRGARAGPLCDRRRPRRLGGGTRPSGRHRRRHLRVAGARSRRDRRRARHPFRHRLGPPDARLGPARRTRGRTARTWPAPGAEASVARRHRPRRGAARQPGGARPPGPPARLPGRLARPVWTREHHRAVRCARSRERRTRARDECMGGRTRAPRARPAVGHAPPRAARPHAPARRDPPALLTDRARGCGHAARHRRAAVALPARGSSATSRARPSGARSWRRWSCSPR